VARTRVGETEVLYRALVGNQKERRSLEHLVVDWRMIIKRI